MRYPNLCVSTLVMISLSLISGALQAQSISDTVYTRIKTCTPFHGNEGTVTLSILRTVESGTTDSALTGVPEVLGKFVESNTNKGSVSETSYSVETFTASELQEIATEMRTTQKLTEDSVIPQTFTKGINGCLVGSGFVETDQPVICYIFRVDESVIVMSKKDFLDLAGKIEEMSALIER